MTATQTIPAEHTVDGVGIQIVNVHDRHGAFVRQLRHRGTLQQARAAARRGFLHPSEPGYVDAVAVMEGLDDAAKARLAAAVAHLYGSE